MRAGKVPKATPINIYRRYYLLSLRDPPTRIERGVEQLGLGADDHPAVARKLKVRAGSAQVDLAEELAGGVPDLDTVAAARVDVAVGVGVHTVRGARVDKGEGLAVVPRAVLEDVKAVAIWYVGGQHLCGTWRASLGLWESNLTWRLGRRS